MLKPYTGWFIKTYILLYILSPVLNAFVENTNRQVYKRVLFFYFVFIFLLGWFKDITGYMMGGYSISMFVGLYLLARYVRVYSPSWSKFSKKKDLAIYLLVTAVTFLGIYIPVYFGLPHSETFVQAFTRYSSPFVVIDVLKNQDRCYTLVKQCSQKLFRCIFASLHVGAITENSDKIV